MYEVILFLISILPVFLIGRYIYKKDSEKEPTRLLVKLFLGGFLSCLIALLIGYLLDFIPIFSADETELNLYELIIYVFIGIAFVEELSKFIVAYKFSYNDSAFNEYYDAILYCIFVALGFACFENLIYVYSSGFYTGIIRAITAVPCHACNGLFMGYYLGLAKVASVNNRNDLKRKYMLLSLVVPTFVHGIYDYCLFTNKVSFLFFFLGFVIYIYIRAFKKVNTVSSINRKFKYQNNYCPHCGHIVKTDFCPMCGKKND